MKKPFRVIVWGPGGLGAICARLVLEKPEFELVGVFVYSKEKSGQDVGDLIGTAKNGIIAISDPEQALSIECDCILYLARDHGNYHFTDEILMILEAGRNVISVLPLQNLDHLGASCPKDFPEKLHAACIKGGAVFHATGIHPSFIAERLAAPLTGLCTNAKIIKVQENWDVSHISAPQLEVCGYGMSPAEAEKQPMAPTIAHNYIEINAESLARALGIKFDRTEIEHSFIPCDRAISSEFMNLEAGTVGLVTHRHIGYVDAMGPDPFQIFEVNWCFTKAMYPEGVSPDQYYIVTIEGTPSLKLSLDIQASFDNNQHFVVPGDPGSEPGYYATVSTCLQAVPHVVNASPGVLKFPTTKWHWAPDLRNLYEAKS